MRKAVHPRSSQDSRGERETLKVSEPQLRALMHSCYMSPEPAWQRTLQTSLVPRAKLWHHESEAHPLHLLRFGRGWSPSTVMTGTIGKPLLPFPCSCTSLRLDHSSASDSIPAPHPLPPSCKLFLSQFCSDWHCIHLAFKLVCYIIQQPGSFLKSKIDCALLKIL